MDTGNEIFLCDAERGGVTNYASSTILRAGARLVQKLKSFKNVVILNIYMQFHG